MRDDTISRQAAIDALAEWHDAAITNRLNNLPSAQPTAEWLECKVIDDVNIDEWQSAKCSACGLYHTTPYMYYFSNYKFCPNCGARMHHERTAHSR